MQLSGLKHSRVADSVALVFLTHIFPEESQEVIINTILRVSSSPKKAPEGYLPEILEAMIVLSEEHELHPDRSWAHLNADDKKSLYQGWEKNMSMGELCNHWTLKKEKGDGEWRETATNTTAEHYTEHLSPTNLPGNGIWLKSLIIQN